MLQCLVSLYIFFNDWFDHDWLEMCVCDIPAGRMVGFCAMCEVKRHIDVVLTASGKVVRPTGIVQRLKSKLIV